MLRKALLAATAAAAIAAGALAQPADANAGVKIHLGFGHGHGLFAPHAGPGFKGHRGWRKHHKVCRWQVKPRKVRTWNRYRHRWEWRIVRQSRRICY